MVDDLEEAISETSLSDLFHYLLSRRRGIAKVSCSCFSSLENGDRGRRQDSREMSMMGGGAGPDSSTIAGAVVIEAATENAFRILTSKVSLID